MNRRTFLRRSSLGLGAVALLAACGPAAPAQPTTPTSSAPAATTAPVSKPAATSVAPAATVGASAPTPLPTAGARPGGGGPLTLLWWQAPTILNAHLSLATKDVGAVRICAEPLADF